MVMNIQQIKPSPPAGPMLTFRSGFGSNVNHTGQDVRRKSKPSHRKNKDERRLYTIHMLNRDEVSMLKSIELDAKLLTGDLDEDIAILDLLA